MNKKIAILGLGHIGEYVFDTLFTDSNFYVDGYDLRDGYDLSNESTLRNIIQKYDGVIASTPYYLNLKIAEICNEFSVDYFDLTESVEVTDQVKNYKNAKFVTQCGLAPGMVSIIANSLTKNFDRLENIEIRVGALPKNANNNLGYYRTWNTEGLINEYIHPCPAIKNGVKVNLDPVTEFEDIILDGTQLEAATTSGGLGSLADSFLHKANNVNYKTLRYPGHWNIIKFLKNDLGLAKNFDTYVKLFNQNIPKTDEDSVFIFINVTGFIGGEFSTRQYSKVISNTDKNTAIQITTGNGLMSIIDVYNKGLLDNKIGHIRQEELEFYDIVSSKFSSCYFETT